MPKLVIRSDSSAGELRRMAGCERNARVARRILAIANALDGLCQLKLYRRLIWR